MAIRYAPVLAAIALIAAAPLPDAAIAKQPDAPTQGRRSEFEGIRNFRDLGGHRTADGHVVKRGLLYRSGSIHALTPGDRDTLAKLGLRALFDFRDRNERARGPVDWREGAPPIFSQDYDLDPKATAAMLSAPDLTADKAEAAMTALYPALLRQLNGQYRRMFGELLAGHAPLGFYCSAGKDRTGIAAALLLTALGVPRETIVEDYLLSNQHAELPPAERMDETSRAYLERIDPAVLRKLLGVERAYIEVVFAQMDAHRGGTAGYLEDELGLTPAAIERLHGLYLR